MMLSHNAEFVLPSDERADQLSLLVLDKVVNSVHLIKEAVQPLYS